MDDLQGENDGHFGWSGEVFPDFQASDSSDC
jgi:hypothetical protein